MIINLCDRFSYKWTEQISPFKVHVGYFAHLYYICSPLNNFIHRFVRLKHTKFKKASMLQTQKQNNVRNNIF